MRISLIILLSFLVAPLPLICQEGKLPEEVDSSGSTRSFAGIHFGVGLSLTFDIGDNARIENATLDELNIIRASKDHNRVARVMLETHYFFQNDRWGKNFGIGPFVALQPGTDEIIEAIGMGLMFGFRKKNSKISESLNIGIGYIVDPAVQILGEGQDLDTALPEGETKIRFRETSQGGILILTSFSF